MGWIRPARWTAGGDAELLGDEWSFHQPQAVSADGAVITGHNWDHDSFCWTASDIHLLESNYKVRMFGLSDDGAVLVGEVAGTPALWTETDGFQFLDASLRGGDALACNSNASLIGGNLQRSHGGAFIWTQHLGLVELREFLEGRFSAVEWPRFTSVEGISADGTRVSGGTLGNAWILIDLPEHCPGDTQLNGEVELLDLQTLLFNFGRTGDATYQHGDCNSDGNVDLDDLQVLLFHFGQTC
ncbi:MAG: hypothetical protein KDA20_01255 [Phycisphaerales bacterium]|nr:hypothetical protein [Phycisphaerales bacterium]